MLVRRIGHWVDGHAVEAAGGRTGPVWDPATGVQQAEVSFASAAEVDLAVEAARGAFPAWRATGLSRRARSCSACGSCSTPTARRWPRLVTAEHGKVLSDAEGEVARGLENLEFACGVPHLLKGAYSEQVSTGVDVHSIAQPLGVVAGITPFNFPAMVPLWMMSNAIACGNCFLLKPREKDPSASLLLADLLWKQAGLPDGVYNVIQGDRVAVDRILEHPDIAAVSFVGSTPIARHIYETGSRHGKRVQALGGAKNHMVVLPDADVDVAADAAVSAGYGSAGERCMAVSAIVAVGRVADPLVEAIAARIPQVQVGPGDDPPRRWARSSPPSTGTGWLGYLDEQALGGADVVVDGRGRRPHPGRASSSAPAWSIRSQPGHCPSTTMRSSGPCSRWCAPTPTTRPSRSSTPTGTPMGWPSSPATAAPPAGSSSTSRWAWSASTCRSRCPSATTALAGGRLAVRRHPHVRTGRDPLLHPDQSRDLPLAGPVDQPWTSASPAPTKAGLLRSRASGSQGGSAVGAHVAFEDVFVFDLAGRAGKTMRPWLRR